MQEPEKRFAFSPVAPQAFAAADCGLGAKGEMPPGIGSANLVIQSKYASSRVTIENSYLGLTDLLHEGGPRVRASNMMLSNRINACANVLMV